MAQIDTNEGDGEDNQLLEWLRTNKLLKAKEKIIEYEVTLDELKEYNLNFLELIISQFTCMNQQIYYIYIYIIITYIIHIIYTIYNIPCTIYTVDLLRMI